MSTKDEKAEKDNFSGGDDGITFEKLDEAMLDKDKEDKNTRWNSPLSMTFRSLTYLGYSSEPVARSPRPLGPGPSLLMVILGPDHRTRHVSYF